jgi:hypothetical protein
VEQVTQLQLVVVVHMEVMEIIQYFLQLHLLVGVEVVMNLQMVFQEDLVAAAVEITPAAHQVVQEHPAKVRMVGKVITFCQVVAAAPEALAGPLITALLGLVQVVMD